MASISSVCIGRRCGLCRFRFELGDAIYAVRQDGQFSVELQYSASMSSIDKSMSVRYNVCLTSCTRECYHFNRAVACHRNCLRLRSDGLLWQFFKATDYDFDVPLEADKSRRRRLHYLLAENMKLPVFLPPELRLKIARDLLQEYAAALAAALPFDPSNLAPEINIAGDVWAHRVEVDGVKYIASLTNGSRPGDSLKLFSAQSVHEFDAVHICEDHLGIREVIFGKEDEPLKAAREPNVWWKRVPLPGIFPNLRSQTDGTKLRSITFVKGSHRVSSLTEIRWPMPAPVKQSLRLYPLLEHRGRNPPPVQMTEIQYNMKGMTGISAAFYNSMISLHVHTKGEETHVFETKQSPVIWLYMPLDEDELITEVWLRKCGLADCTYAIVLKTNKHRTCSLGTYMPPLMTRGVQEWMLLDRPNGMASHLFYEKRMEGSRCLGFETKVNQKGSDPPEVSEAVARSGFMRRFGYVYYSSAPLESLIAIRRCFHGIESGNVSITGMLIRYGNGHIERVGEVRLDRLEPEWLERGSKKLTLGFSFSRGYPYVSQLEFTNGWDYNNEEKMELSMDGLLEWWFTSNEIDIRHGEKRSPRAT